MRLRVILFLSVLALAALPLLEGEAQTPGRPPTIVPPAPPPTPPRMPSRPAARAPARNPGGGGGTGVGLAERAHGEAGEGALRLKFNAAPLDIVLQDYSEHTGRTLLLAPNLPKAAITLQSQGDLSMEEYLEAVKTVLGMNGVALLAEGEKFLRVVPIDKARLEPMPIRNFEAAGELEDSGELISQMVPLTNIDPAEAQKAIEPLKHAFGQIHIFERINSLMITDTAANVRRIMEIVEYIDQAVPAREEPIIVEIIHAKAADIKSKLEEIIAEQLKEDQPSTVPVARTSGPPGVVAPPSPILSSIIRARAPRPGAPQQTTAEIEEMAKRGIITGTVKIVADERTNILIIITRKENMSFFEKVIKVLDVETSPEFIVKMVRLEYAKAEDVEGMLNDLIGAASSSKDDDSEASSKFPSRNADPDRARGSPLGQYSNSRNQPPTASGSTPGRGGAAGGEGGKQIGQLSKENIKILSDERTNALIIMASRGDMAVLDEIIKGMDVKLAQVLIESAVLSVQLDEGLKTGFDWVQRSMIAYENGRSGAEPAFSFAGGGGSGSGFDPRDATTMQRASSLQGGPALTYYFTHFGMSVDAVLTMAQTDSRAKVLASPVIMTHDNTEAVVDASQERYFYKGQRYVGGAYDGSSGGRYEPDVERRKVGLHLKVTPHINEKEFVLMEITQQIEELGPDQQIGDESWPTVLSREMSASISVQSRETIILGGLVRQTEKYSRSGIPFLYKIPLLGLLLGGRDSSQTSDELIVFITPYVLNSDDATVAESARRKASLDMGGFWKQGWTGSRLADPVKKSKELLEIEERYRLEKQERVKEEPKPLGHIILGGEEPASAGRGKPVREKPSAEVDVPPARVLPAVKREAEPAAVLDIDPSVAEYLKGLEERLGDDLKKVDERVEEEAEQGAER